MKVTMRTLASGPDGHTHPGTTVDLPEAQARELVDGGFATLAVEDDQVETAPWIPDADTETTDKPRVRELRAKKKK